MIGKCPICQWELGSRDDPEFNRCSTWSRVATAIPTVSFRSLLGYRENHYYALYKDGEYVVLYNSHLDETVEAQTYTGLGICYLSINYPTSHKQWKLSLSEFDFNSSDPEAIIATVKMLEAFQ